jgi:hypothetical protein
MKVIKRKSKSKTRVAKPGQSRQLDNHFNTDVHDRAWITAGKTPQNKYNYGDSGLGCLNQNNPKLKHYKMKYQLEQEVQGLIK